MRWPDGSSATRQCVYRHRNIRPRQWRYSTCRPSNPSCDGTPDITATLKGHTMINKPQHDPEANPYAGLLPAIDDVLANWGKPQLAALTDNQLSDCLHEMRRRGWVVAAYAANDVGEIVARDDVETDEIAEWLTENSVELEQALCEGMYRAVEDQWPEQDDE
jgi:hypothetical protein